MLVASPIGSSVGPYKSVLWPRDLKGPPPGSKGSPCVGKGEDGPAHLLQDRQGHVSVSTTQRSDLLSIKGKFWVQNNLPGSSYVNDRTG